MQQLPKRPETHVKDTRGLKRLLNFFRDEWVIRFVYPDYGIDYEIEPWKNSKPVNKIAKIQVKNNESVNENFEPINVLKFKVSTINYLNFSNNSYIISITKENLFCFNVNSIFNTFNINQDKVHCNIPLVYRRPFKSQQYSTWIDFPNHRIIFNLLGSELALNELESNFKERDSFENYYLTTVKGFDEKDFFDREELANFGYYYSTLKKNKKQAILKLLGKLETATHLQRRGIIEGLAHLNYKNEETEKIALEMISSNYTQDVLVGLMHLSIPNENKHLDIYLKAIYSYFDYRDCIIMDEETHGIELTSIDALFNISTKESLSLVVEIFCSSVFKPTEVSLIYNLFKNCHKEKQIQLLSLINKQKGTNYKFSEYQEMLTNYYDLNTKSKN